MWNISRDHFTCCEFMLRSSSMTDGSLTWRCRIPDIWMSYGQIIWIYKWTMAKAYMITEFWPTNSAATDLGKPNHNFCSSQLRMVTTWSITAIPYSLPLGQTQNQPEKARYASPTIQRVLGYLLLLHANNFQSKYT